MIATDLHHYLRQSRESMLRSLDGLSEYDVRRPMTPTATNLLGLVKHLAGIEFGYLGDCVGRPAPVPMPWTDETIWDSADMWALPDESRDYLVGFTGGPGSTPTKAWNSSAWTLRPRSRGGRRNAVRPRSGTCSCAWSRRPPSTRATPTSSAR